MNDMVHKGRTPLSGWMEVLGTLGYNDPYVGKAHKSVRYFKVVCGVSLGSANAPTHVETEPTSYVTVTHSVSSVNIQLVNERIDGLDSADQGLEISKKLGLLHTVRPTNQSVGIKHLATARNTDTTAHFTASPTSPLVRVERCYTVVLMHPHEPVSVVMKKKHRTFARMPGDERAETWLFRTTDHMQLSTAPSADDPCCDNTHSLCSTVVISQSSSRRARHRQLPSRVSRNAAA